MKRLIIFLINLSFFISTFAQEITVIGKVKDIDNKPVEAVNIYIQNQEHNGTISNEEGIFHFKLKIGDTLIFSHINYKPQLRIITKKNDLINVNLQAYSHELDEIKVSGRILTALEIIQKVSQNLKTNHYSEANFYEMLSRSWTITENKLDIFEEYLLHVYEKQVPMPKCKVIKGRAKAFSEEAKKNFDEHKLFNVLDSWEDYYLLLLTKCLKEKHLDNFKYSIKKNTNIDNTQYYNILCLGKDNNERFELIVDKFNFGVKQFKSNETKYGYQSQNTYNYLCINDKWYLKSSIDYSKSIDSNISRYDLYVYKLINKESFKNYESIFKIGRMKANKYSNNFDDTFWKDYDYIPIPEKIKEMMGN